MFRDGGICARPCHQNTRRTRPNYASEKGQRLYTDCPPTLGTSLPLYSLRVMLLVRHIYPVHPLKTTRPRLVEYLVCCLVRRGLAGSARPYVRSPVEYYTPLISQSCKMPGNQVTLGYVKPAQTTLGCALPSANPTAIKPTALPR